MPVICIYGIPVRVRPMLNAIGEQEAMEQFSTTKPDAVWGSARQRDWDRRQLGFARRRNAAEKALRSEERRAWDAWRKAPKAEREAVWAVLTDLPGREEGKPQT